MKKLYLFAMAAAVTLQAGAAVPFLKGATPPRQHRQTPAAAPSLRAPATQMLVDEDFSRFTEGSEAAPAADITSSENYHISADFTAQPGWTGRGVHPAGGCVVLQEWAIDEDYTRGGYMSTPPALLNGTATLTFRAKKFGTEDASMWVAVCDDYYGPGDDQEDYPLTEEWQTFTFVATHASLDEMSYIQMMADKGSAVLDDVKLTFVMDRIASPSTNAAVNLSPTSFKASWEEVPGADGYLLTVLCTEAPAEVVTGEIAEGFEGIALSADGKKIDTANPGYPEGWTIDVSTNGTQDATTDPGQVASGSKALMFDAVGDVIETADAPLPLDGLSFWAKPVGPDETDYGYMSLIKVELFHTSTQSWDHVANLYYADFDEDGAVYTLSPMNFTDDISRVRLSMLQQGTKTFFIDDIKMHYRTRGTVTKLLDDYRVNGTEYDVVGIRPANEYTYSVKAFLGDVVSEPGYSVWVDGVAGLKVDVHEATDVTKTSFTASWEPLGHATDYTVSLSKVVSPVADLSDVVVLEEDFSGVTEGTPENPGMDWQSPKDFGAAGFSKTSWFATQPAWAAGMVGTTGTSWYGTAGLVFTPTLDLSCYDGQGIAVTGSFYTTVADLSDFGVDESEGIFAMLMNSYTDSQPIAAGLLETPVAGLNSGNITIANVPDDTDLSGVIIAFMNKSGRTFFVDDVKITMNVPAGKSLVTPVEAVTVQDTRHTFEGLNPDCDHAYQVTAGVTRNYSSYISLPSDVKVVKTSSAGVDDIEADDAAQAEYFNLQGIRVAPEALVPGIYIERRGNVARKVLKH